MSNENKIKFIQRRLWSNGHKVKRVPDNMGFHLIVDEEIRVKIFFDHSEERIFDKFDIAAIIVKSEIDGHYDVFYGGKVSTSRKIEETIRKEVDHEISKKNASKKKFKK